MKIRSLLIYRKICKICDCRARLKKTATLLALLSVMLPGQTLSGLLGNKQADSSNHAQADPLNRATPRSAILNFLEACHAERYVLAARYLDLQAIPADQRKTQGPELAKQLADLLNKEPRFEVEALSDNPEGNTSDGLAFDVETLVTLNIDGAPAALLLRRSKQQGIDVWLVSSDSVPRIPDLDALEGASAIAKSMPRFLVTHAILGTPLWAWLALIALMLLLILLSRLLSRLFLTIFTPLVKRFATSLQSYRLSTLADPLRLLISIGVFRALMELVTPSALLRDYLIKLLAFLSTFGFAALIVRIVDLVATQVRGRLGPKEHALSYSVLPLGVRFVRIFVFLIAALAILASWGYNTNAILAGLGVGGLAIALAAQKTIENLFGGIALITDRPVLVGDYCQFGSQSGTVEDIGLRSTRIRTNDRTLVTIPNSSFSTMTIENFSRRERIWFHPTLRLRRDTSSGKVREMMDAIAAILRNNPLVQAGDLPVRLTKISDYSLDLEIFAYVDTADFNEYLKVQTTLLLQFIETSQEHGVGFAVPLTEALSVSPPASSPATDSGFRPVALPRSAPQPQD